jgi:hypothetical protein
MSLNKGYEKYLKKRGGKKLIQAHIDEGLHQVMADILEETDLSWSEFVAMMCEKFLDDHHVKKDKAIG